MTTFTQFFARAKMRHDFSDQIQVRYPHPNGEEYDTWVSGEEVMQRLQTQSREELIRSFSRLDLDQAGEEVKKQVEQGKEKLRQDLSDRLADAVSDNLGDNVFGQTVADKIRGVDSSLDAHDEEKKVWQARLQDDAFRLVVLDLAWINLDGSLPDEKEDEEPDDWF